MWVRGTHYCMWDCSTPEKITSMSFLEKKYFKSVYASLTGIELGCGRSATGWELFS